MTKSNMLIPRWLILASGTFIAFLIAYLFAVQEGIAQGLTDHSIHVTEASSKRTIRFTNNFGVQNFEIEYQGKIEVTDDDKDVKAISPGGFLEISKTTFGTKREIYIEADGSGRLKKTYFEGRKEMPFEPDGKKWLSEILPEIVRTTRIAAESRVDRFYSKGGVNAVLNELRNISSDYVKIHYADLLLKKNNLKSSELITIVNRISDEISSDYYLATLLKDQSAKFLEDPKVSEAYFEGLANISSDYYLSVVLKHAIQNSKPSNAAMKKLINAVDQIESDYYQTVVISTLLDDKELSGETLNSLISASKNIGSDYYQSSILKKALEHKNLSDEAFKSLLLEVSNVSSDYYMATIFGDLLQKDLDNNMKIYIVNTVSEKMTSDYYLSTLLIRIFEHGEVTPELAEAALNALNNMDSDHYASTVIAKAAERSGKIDKKSLLSLIKATESISSDYYQSVALIKLSDAVNSLNDSEVKNAYRNSAKLIGSDTYYGKTLKAIN